MEGTDLVLTLRCGTFRRVIVHGDGSSGPAGRGCQRVGMAVVAKVGGGEDGHASQFRRHQRVALIHIFRPELQVTAVLGRPVVVGKNEDVDPPLDFVQIVHIEIGVLPPGLTKYSPAPM